MKRIICLVMAVIFCFGIWGCAEKVELTDATGVYTAAREKTDTLVSFDATMVMSVKFDTEKATGTESTVNVALDRRDPEAPIFYKEYNINDLSLGKEYVTSMYYADNVVYEKSGIGEKYMTAASVESVESSFESVSVELPEEIFKESEVKEKTVKAKTDASKISQLIEGFLSGVPTYFSSLKEDGSFEYTYSEVSVEFATDDKGYFDYISIACSAEFDHADGHNKADISMTVTYNDPGEDVDITAPDDLSEYTWYDGSDMTQEELEAQMMEDILALFIFEDGTATRVENFDELYIIACSKYGKETVDMYVETVEMLGGLTGN